VDVKLGDDGLVLSAAPEGQAHGEEALGLRRPESPAGPGWQPATVELLQVSRSRGAGAGRRPVLRSFTRALTPGRLTAVIGPSGCGKTTLLRLLAALDTPEDGEVLVERESTSSWDAERRAELRRRRIGYLPQEPSPVAFLSAAENVALSLRLRGWPAAEALERAAVILSWVDLTDRSLQRVERLSAGEAQRVALARALASARGLLVVDEPTSRLDEARAADVGKLLARAALEDGQTVVCATHDPQLIRSAHEIIDLR